MPFRYERDDIERRVVVTLHGAFQRENGLAVRERLRLEDLGSYAVLYDLLGLTGEPTIADMRMFMSAESTLATDKARGPIAIVANNPAIYGMACTYAALGRPKLNIRVFREREEADVWLTAQSKQ